ncbi:MAG: class II aldolase/adducin family protein [Negativicutes bacterium]
MKNLYPLREEIARTSQELYRSGMTCSTGGNISVRSGEVILISKTDTSFSRLQATDVIVCDLTGNPLEEGIPSKEVGFHAEVYQLCNMGESGAVVHLHSPYSIALGAFPLNKQSVLPPCTYGAVTRVGKVPMVEFYPPGRPELIRRIAEELPHAQNAVYLAKHGIITFAENLGRACDIAEEFEQNAKIYVLTAGKVPLLSDKEVADVLGDKK